MARTVGAGYRKLNDKEFAHIKRLLWRVTLDDLAEVSGAKRTTLSRALKEYGRGNLHPDAIAKLVKLNPKQLPSTRVRY